MEEKGYAEFSIGILGIIYLIIVSILYWDTPLGELGMKAWVVPFLWLSLGIGIVIIILIIILVII